MDPSSYLVVADAVAKAVAVARRAQKKDAEEMKSSLPASLPATLPSADKVQLETVPGDKLPTYEEAFRDIRLETRHVHERPSDAPKFDMGFDEEGIPMIGEDFIVRAGPLKDMENYIFSEGRTAQQRPLILWGMAGIGKTQLAIAFAQKFRSLFSTVFFLNASGREALEKSMEKAVAWIWEKTKYDIRIGTKPLFAGDYFRQVFLRWLNWEGNNQWLVIYDGVDDEPSDDFDLRHYLPRPGQGTVIITTRLGWYQRLGHPVYINKLSPSESSELLRSALRGTDWDDSHDLAEVLGGLPLALVQAGRYLVDTGMSITTFVDEYRSSKSRAEVLQTLDSSDPVPSEERRANASIRTTWDYTLKQLLDDPQNRSRYQNAGRLLLLCGYLDPKELWYELFQRGLLMQGVPGWFRDTVKSRFAFESTVGLLVQYSMVHIRSKKGIYSMHNLLHDYCEDQANRRDPSLLTLAVSIVGYSVPSTFHPDRFAVCRRLLPDTLQVLAHINNDPTIIPKIPGLDTCCLGEPEKTTVAELLRVPLCPGISREIPLPWYIHPVSRIARLLRWTGHFEMATSLLQTAFENSKALLGENNPFTWDIATDLAWAYYYNQDYEKMEAYARAGYNANKKILSTKHFFVSSSVLTLGSALLEVGKVDEARQLLEAARHDYEERGGKLDLNAIRATNVLAFVYKEEGDKSKMLETLRDAHQRYEQRLGWEHPVTVKAAAKLGDECESNLFYDDSERWKRLVLSGYEKSYGPDDPRTIEQAKAIDKDLRAHKKPWQCIDVWQCLIQMIETKDNPNPVSLTWAWKRLAETYLDCSAREQSTSCLQYAEEAFAKVSPDQIDDRVHLWGTIGWMHRRLGHYEKAVSLLKSALATLDKYNRAPTQRMFWVLDDLWLAYDKLEDTPSSVQITRRLAEASTDPRIADKDMAVTWMLRAALRFIRLGLYYEAEPLLERAHSHYASVRGAEAEETLMCEFHLGRCARKLGKLDQAKAHFEAVAALADKSLLPDDTIALDSFRELGMILKDQGPKGAERQRNLEAAGRWLRKSLEGYRRLQMPRDAIFAAFELGNIYVGLEQYEEAEDMFRSVVKAPGKQKESSRGESVSKWPQEDFIVNVARSQLGLMSQYRGDLDAAISLWEEALEGLRRDNHGEDSTECDVILVRLGPTYLKRGRYAEALVCFNALLKLRQSTLGSLDPRTADILMVLSMVYLALSRRSEAMDCAVQAADGYARAHDVLQWKVDGAKLIEAIAGPVDHEADSPLEWRLEVFLHREYDDIRLIHLLGHEIPGPWTQEPGPGKQVSALVKNIELLEDCLKKASTTTQVDTTLAFQVELQQIPRGEEEEEQQETEVSSLRHVPSRPTTQTAGLSEATQSGSHSLPTEATRLTPETWKEVRDALPQGLRDNIRLSFPKAGKPAWTFTPYPDSGMNADEVPLTIAGAPVVIPVRYRYPPVAGVAPPPDPHPQFIDPAAPISQETIEGILKVYDGALGFFLLINGMLQIIVPDDFDSGYALSHRPNTFGGLSVSYIHQFMEPTMERSVSSQAPSVASSDRGSAASGSHGFLSFLNLLQRRPTPRTPELSVNDYLEAKAKHGGWTKERSKGRVGLKTINRAAQSFLTMSTHVLKDAVTPHGQVPRTRGDLKAEVEVYAGGAKIGRIARIFDTDPWDYPGGYKHDVSLIRPTSESLVKNIVSPIPGLGWLSERAWNELRREPGNLKAFGLRPEKDREGKSLRNFDQSDFLIVGLGIVCSRHPVGACNSLLEASEFETSDWTRAASRCQLYRLSPALENPTSCSGLVLYAEGEREDGTTGPGVVGLQSFAQHQDYFPERPLDFDESELRARLRRGMISFYGAFLVPDDVRKNYTIA